MDYKELTPIFFVSGQIKAHDIEIVKNLGFTDIICNRPSHESSCDEKPDIIGDAASRSGITFYDNPFPSIQLSVESISRQKTNGAKTLAYCTSGTRSAILWAFSMASDMETTNILQCLAKAGFPMPHLADQIDSFGKISIMNEG